jgi:hypothetical protein
MRVALAQPGVRLPGLPSPQTVFEVAARRPIMPQMTNVIRNHFMQTPQRIQGAQETDVL